MHKLSIVGSQGTCTCGWRTSSGCAMDMIEEWDKHDKASRIGMLPEAPPGTFVDEFFGGRSERQAST